MYAVRYCSMIFCSTSLPVERKVERPIILVRSLSARAWESTHIHANQPFLIAVHRSLIAAS
jgi:hypothetical protein